MSVTFRITPLSQTSQAGHPGEPRLYGFAEVPGDKSIGHRALLFSGLATGETSIAGLGSGADNGRTSKAITQLGAVVRKEGDKVIVQGAGLALKPPGTIDCGNSGTTMRLLAGLLGMQPFETKLIGDESLTRRPMQRVAEPINAMGGVVRSIDNNGAAPLLVGGSQVAPKPSAMSMTVASAQVKSAAILAALYVDGVTTIFESAPTRDHSERMLQAMGAPLECIREAGGVTVRIDTTGWDRKLHIAEFAVPRDPSAAAFLMVAGLITNAPNITCPDVCINPTRTGFIDALLAMNGVIEPQAERLGGREPVADLCVSRGAGKDLRGAELGGDIIVRAIDEVPVLAIAAARARGTTVIKDAEELRVKESDRIVATIAMLRAFGVEVVEQPDGMIITGQPDKPFRGGATIHSFDDHRISMAATVGALCADGPTTITGCDNVGTSFPNFVEVMRSLGAEIAVDITAEGAKG